MPVVPIDQDLLNEILRIKQLIKGSVNGVMDGTLTAGHLASDVQILLDLLDSIQIPKVEAQAAPAPPTTEQPAQTPKPEQTAKEIPVTVETPAQTQ